MKSKDVIGFIIGMGFLVIAILMVYEAFVRKAGRPTSWAYPIALFLFAWSGILSIAYAESEEQHITVELISFYSASFVSIVKLFLIVSMSLGVASTICKDYMQGITTYDLLRTPVWLTDLAYFVAFVIMLASVGTQMYRAILLFKAER